MTVSIRHDRSEIVVMGRFRAFVHVWRENLDGPSGFPACLREERLGFGGVAGNRGHRGRWGGVGQGRRSRLRRDPHPLAPSPTRTHAHPGDSALVPLPLAAPTPVESSLI